MRGWERRRISTKGGAERISKSNFILAILPLGGGSVGGAFIERSFGNPTIRPGDRRPIAID
jgi:hypothetical protein